MRTFTERERFLCAPLGGLLIGLGLPDDAIQTAMVIVGVVFFWLAMSSNEEGASQ